MPERGYWQHSLTGQMWAVETENGRPICGRGPLESRDALPLLLPHLSLSWLQVGYLTREWARFMSYETCRICGKVIRPGAVTVGLGHPGDRVHDTCAITAVEGTDSVGAAVHVEPLWEISVRLGERSALLRRRSHTLRLRSRALLVKYACDYSVRHVA